MTVSAYDLCMYGMYIYLYADLLFILFMFV
jgi:hypothetical protein